MEKKGFDRDFVRCLVEEEAQNRGYCRGGALKRSLWFNLEQAIKKF